MIGFVNIREDILKYFLIVCIIYVFADINVYAQTIFLKRTFLTYEFSRDSINYQSIGPGASTLKRVMSNDEDCMSLLKSYSIKQSFSYVAGFPGIIFLGWSLGIYIAGTQGEPDSDLNLIFISGLIFSAGAIALDILANADLKEAVEKYNTKQINSVNKIGWNLIIDRQTKTFKLGIKYHL